MISASEAEKYPFLKRAVSLLETFDLKVDDLADPAYARVLERAEQRVSDAILGGVVGIGPVDDVTELLSFPVAVMFVTVIGDRFLNRRYSLAEAARAFRLLREESEERVAELAKGEFGWDLRIARRTVDGQVHAYDLHFGDYLRCAAGLLHEDKWKLVNRLMRDGRILLTRAEAARLFQVEVEGLILGRVSRRVVVEVPEAALAPIERLRRLLDENRSRIGGEELPSEAVGEAFPPCIRHAYEGLVSGRRLSHMERFALTSFLINAGVERERIVQIFVSATDFDEQLTRYQIEHIAGLRGSRTRYTPPTCGTMRTHGVCHSPDALCRRIRHPLGYYRLRARELERKAGRGRPPEGGPPEV